MRDWFRTGGTALVVAAVLGGAAPAWADASTERVSVGPGGAQANGQSYRPAISADGRFVVFVSDATNLVLGDRNNRSDAFIRDLGTGRTALVSVGLGGALANGLYSEEPSVSADGRFVAFASDASNLVPGDTDGWTDIFVRDRLRGTTERVSVGPGGVQSNNYSHNRPAISADGRFVAFSSSASNLVPGDTPNSEGGWGDVFVRDRLRGTTERASIGLDGVQANGNSGDMAISADGRFVVFGSSANNLTLGDHNNRADVFVRDRQRRVTRRVSVGPSNGASDHPAISAGGRFVAFSSNASNLVSGDNNGVDDVFVRRRW